jgi:hypothetical protein
MMAAPSSPQPGSTVVAHSALLTLTAVPADHALSLQVARLSDHRLIVGSGSVTATLDGHSVPVTAQPDGSYLISTRNQSGGDHSLGVVVSHDGIRELLTGTVTVPQRRSALDVIQGHGMFAWWVLNIAVVLIAVIVISRRRG